MQYHLIYLRRFPRRPLHLCPCCLVYSFSLIVLIRSLSHGFGLTSVRVWIATKSRMVILANGASLKSDGNNSDVFWLGSENGNSGWSWLLITATLPSAIAFF